MPRAFSTRSIASVVTCRRTSRVYPPGSVIFTEGDVPEGVHILESGTAILYGTTSQGRLIVAKTVHSGEFPGLNAVILGKPYLFSLKVTEPSRVAYVKRNDFLKFLDQSPEAATVIIRQLSNNYYDAQREVRTLSLSSNTVQRLARLLVLWIEDSDVNDDDEIWVSMDLTHQEIAQMVGASRETVSRVLARLTRSGVIEVKGHALRIPSVSRLRQMARL